MALANSRTLRPYVTPNRSGSQASNSECHLACPPCGEAVGWCFRMRTENLTSGKGFVRVPFDGLAGAAEWPGLVMIGSADFMIRSPPLFMRCVACGTVGVPSRCPLDFCGPISARDGLCSGRCMRSSDFPDPLFTRLRVPWAIGHPIHHGWSAWFRSIRAQVGPIVLRRP